MPLALNDDKAVPAELAPGLWRADALAQDAGPVLASGHAALDAVLPGGGWPVGALCEVLQAPLQQHEWRLLLPALRGLLDAGVAGCSGAAPWVVLVGTPYTPFGPGLQAQGLDVRQLLWVRTEDAQAQLWSTEQALRCQGVGAVLAWLPLARSAQLRRLQVAAQAHHKLLFVMRPVHARQEASPAVLRVAVSVGNDGGLDMQVLKRRGPYLAQTLHLGQAHAVLAALLARSPLAQPTVVMSASDELAADQTHALDRLASAA